MAKHRRPPAGTMLPRTSQGKVLALGSAVDAMGIGLFLAAATLYFVSFIGISAVAIGGAIAMANVCGLISPIPLGRMAERVGVVPLYIALALLRAALYSGYIFVNGYLGYLVLTCLVTALNRAAAPLLQVIVGEFEGVEDRTQTMASLRSINNVGLTAGFMIAGTVQSFHSRFAFAVLFLCSGGAYVLVALTTVRASRVVRQLRAAAGPAPLAAEFSPPVSTVAQVLSEPERADSSPYRDGRFIVVAAANAVLLLHDSILFILLPLWLVERGGVSPTVSSALLALNTVITVLLQPFLARFAKGMAGALRTLRISCVALVLTCTLFAVSAGRPSVVLIIGAGLAVILLTVGENLHAVAGWELSFEMAPPTNRVRYLSLFSLGVSAQMVVGPILMTAVVLPHGAFGWSLIGLLFVLAAAVTITIARPYQATRPLPAAEILDAGVSRADSGRAADDSGRAADDSHAGSQTALPPELDAVLDRVH